MALIYELATDYNYPNINVYRRYINDVFNGWKFETAEDYVMYDTTANNTEAQIDPTTGLPVFDPATGQPVEIPVTYYYTVYTASKNYNFDNFHWVAVPRDSVDENYIFGVGEPEHEVM